MSVEEYENEKRERRRLRAQQNRLTRKYSAAVHDQNPSKIAELKEQFLDNLEVEKRVEDFIGIEVSRYPIALDNLFRALGFEIYMGPMPTVSGTQPDGSFHLAYDDARMILIRDFPANLLAEIVDIQPLASKPVLGVSHTTWCRVKKRESDDWEDRYSRISTSLGIGRLQFRSPKMIEDAIRLDPEEDNEKARRLAEKTGLTTFLSLPVDNLPIYGTFRTGERSAVFTEKNLKRMLFNSIERGHELALGTKVSAEPLEVLKNPRTLVNELNKADLIQGKDKMQITAIGKRYVRDQLTGTPQEAALLKAADFSLLDNLRAEFRILEERLQDSILGSKRDVLHAIREVKLQISEVRDGEKAVAKYVIETPPFSPIKLQLEIPICEMTEEDVLLKIAEMKARTTGLPAYLIIELREALRGLRKIPTKIRKKLLDVI